MVPLREPGTTEPCHDEDGGARQRGDEHHDAIDDGGGDPSWRTQAGRTERPCRHSLARAPATGAGELGCTYLGVDSSSSAVDIARERAGGLPCRFEVSRIPPIAPGPFDVVLLFETMLAFREKETLLQEVSLALRTGGRFAFTVEEGLPLTEAERERMPDADTVWLTPLPEMLTCLERVGLVVRWRDDCSRSHRAVADSLITAFAADAADIAAQIGRRALEELLAAHRLWSDWLREGRVRKIAFVAEKTDTPRTTVALGIGRRWAILKR